MRYQMKIPKRQRIRFLNLITCFGAASNSMPFLSQCARHLSQAEAVASTALTLSTRSRPEETDLPKTASLSDLAAKAPDEAD